ncbi:hypothetical protein DFH06DRAFT_1343555 [Mycena polygramma]|nr:hypothetical protein DFH06DRAFT_1153225 [Mycena polygramma]KAJ7615785.1 hypothetical protein DFH06DRAFT_1343555 [Mycena polygramma]
MTNHGHVAPAAANTVAGAGALIANIQQSLDVLSAAVDTLSGCTSSLVATSMLDMGDAIGSVVAAADAVRRAQEDVDAAFKALGPLPTSAQAAAPPPFVPVPTNTFIRSTGPWNAGVLYSVIPAAPLSAVPDNGGKWHAITRGKYIGLTQNSAVSLNAVTGISTGLSQKFSNQADALNSFNAALATSALAVVN